MSLDAVLLAIAGQLRIGMDLSKITLPVSVTVARSLARWHRKADTAIVLYAPQFRPRAQVNARTRHRLSFASSAATRVRRPFPLGVGNAR